MIVSDVSIVSDPLEGRVSELAAFIRTSRTVDRGELLEQLLEQFHDLTAAELNCAINLRSRPLLVLAQQAQADDAG